MTELELQAVGAGAGARPQVLGRRTTAKSSAAFDLQTPERDGDALLSDDDDENGAGGVALGVSERVFLGLAWLPKATVQAALGAVPLDLLREQMRRDAANGISPADGSSPTMSEKEIWAKRIATTAIISIIITAPIGLLVI